MATLEQFLSNKLRKFSIIDFMCVKAVYFVFALFLVSLYPPLKWLSPWAYLILAVLAALPLWVHFAAAPGNFFEKSKHYLRTNTPSNQVLTLIYCFSIGALVAILLPILVSFSWWVYVLAMVVLGIKPIRVAWYW